MDCNPPREAEQARLVVIPAKSIGSELRHSPGERDPFPDSACLRPSCRRTLTEAARSGTHPADGICLTTTPMMENGMLPQTPKLYLKLYETHFRFRVRTVLRAAGLRKERPVEAPPLVDDADEALRRRDAQFWCPVELCLCENARAFGHRRWHPLSETAKEIVRSTHLDYRGSILDRYYKVWQPQDAASAVIGLDESARGLRGLPAHAYHMVPWGDRPLDDMLHLTELWQARDMSEHGHRVLGISRFGFNGHGPVSEALGRVEFTRLLSLVRAIRDHGYDRTAGLDRGDRGVCVGMMKRGQERRFINGGGHHRTAVMHALGQSHIPARCMGVIDRDEAADWAGVRSGLWTLEEALRYFDHLFDFDTRSWAEARGLCVA